MAVTEYFYDNRDFSANPIVPPSSEATKAPFQLQKKTQIIPIPSTNTLSSNSIKYQSSLFTEETIPIKDLRRLSIVKGNLHHNFYSDRTVAE